MTARVDVEFPVEAVALLTLDNGPMNFSNWELFEHLADALAQIRDEVKVVVVASAVDGYFIAHGHIGNVVATFGEEGETPPGDPRGGLRAQRELDTGPMVSIAAIDGQAWGGGAELAWSCDFRVASERATFGQPEVLIGVPPAGGAARIAHLAGEAAAKRLVLDGRPVSAAEALRLGLVDRVVPAGEAVTEALDWARWLARRPEWALAQSKEIIVGARGLTLGDALRRETGSFVAQFMRPEVRREALAVQQRYDEGADSYAAFLIDPP